MGIADDIRGAPVRLVGIDAPVEAKDEIPGDVGVDVEFETTEEIVVIDPAVSEVGIRPSEDALEVEIATDVGFTDVMVWLPLTIELEEDCFDVTVAVKDCSSRSERVLESVTAEEDDNCVYKVDVDVKEAVGLCVLPTSVSEGMREKTELLSSVALDEAPVPKNPVGVDCWDFIAEEPLSMAVGVGVRIREVPVVTTLTDWLDRELVNEELGSRVSLGNGPV